eukprot:gnl/TRDRNA2_/TRDRNA2_188436_c0_seq1.p1 gnl/TRDRNA2_/TRDRNA2_188436_c0~~gnl/TRDRNA2_/TRDRNA2_188436_c0_seq1.p1  ORF type:complete len:166 (+),score=39.99 gnl/TRDRNA2_/TRDRNA2_188436_c0_seq1:87-584(+)
MGDEAEEDVTPLALDAKIVKYEAFIEDVLKRQLKLSLDEFRKEADLLERCRELRQNIGLLMKENVSELESMVELGCQFYAKAFVPDTSRIFVDVGLGFHLEMPLSEAHEFLALKEELIIGGLEKRKRRTAQIKADIHEALHLMDLMMQIRGGQTPWMQDDDPGSK